MADKMKRRIPKHIGGVKIPKEVRRTGEALIDSAIEKAQSQQGRESIARALTLAATVATAAVAKGRASRAEGAPVAPTAPAAPTAPPPVAAPIADPVPPPPVPPRGTSQEPDFAAIAETIGSTAEMMLGRLFGKKP